MTTRDSAGFQYGMVVWALSLENSLVDRVWHRDFWEGLRDRTGFILRDEFDAFLQERGTSFEEEYRTFLRDAATGAQSDFAVGVLTAAQWYPDALAGEHQERDYPVDETVNGDARAERPQYLGQNYVFFDSDGVDRDKALLIEFWGDGDKNDLPVEWMVELIALKDERADSTHSLVLDGHDPNRDGYPREWRGAVMFNDFRGSSEGILLGVSPVTDFGDGGATWGYTATLVDSDGDDGFADAPVEEGDDDDDDTGGDCTDCAASTAPRGFAAPAGVALILCLTAGIRRRRPSSAI
jgi:hypothetical protein